MNENENGGEATLEVEPVVVPTENQVVTEVAPAETTAVTPEEKVPAVRRWQFIVVAVLIVLGIFTSIFYAMEKKGQLNTGVFDGFERFQAAHSTAATVNGVKISGLDLATSVDQISAGAEAQGVDTTDPSVMADIKSQAIDMLINTELLKQEAAVRGIVITDEDVETRYASLVEEVGGEEALQERMAQFDVSAETLRRDIKNELTIQALLDQVFAAEPITASEEEIAQLYDSAGGEAAELPPLEEVRAQIEAQVTGSKQQEIVTKFVDELRAKAEVEVLTDVQ